MSTIEEDEYQPLSMWTVYDHPDDFPRMFIARRYEVTALQIKTTVDALASEDLESIRKHLRRLGLTVVGRYEDDDPKTLETWI